jgi:hypothetical protein
MSRKGISQAPQQLKQKTFSFAFEKHSFDFSSLPAAIILHEMFAFVTNFFSNSRKCRGENLKQLR